MKKLLFVLPMVALLAAGCNSSRQANNQTPVNQNTNPASVPKTTPIPSPTLQSKSNRTYHITMDTSPLIGHPAGPFSLSFQLTDGSAKGDANNTIVLSNFRFGNGTASGEPSIIGGVSGNISSKITLNDSSFLNYYIQPFVPGQQLQFDLTTTNVIESGTPDNFSLNIQDKSGQEIPTTTGQKFYDEFVILTLNNATPSIKAYASDASRSPAQGSPIRISAPTIQTSP